MKTPDTEGNKIDLNKLRNNVKSIMSKISRIEMSELEDNVKFREELGVDSLMAMEIIANCEKQLNMHIDETGLGTIDTIGDFINYISDLWVNKA